jgi:proteasome lid subunit RPN8/RPN11
MRQSVAAASASMVNSPVVLFERTVRRDPRALCSQLSAAYSVPSHPTVSALSRADAFGRRAGSSAWRKHPVHVVFRPNGTIDKLKLDT